MKTLIEGSELLDQVPVTESLGHGLEVRLDHGLILRDDNFFQYPTVVLGNVGTGKTTLIKQILEPILEHAQRHGDNVVIFAPKPDMLAYARPGDIVIRVDSTDPGSCWNIFEEMDASGDPELTIREIANGLFQEARDKTNQVFFPNAARKCFRNTALFMYHYGKEHGERYSNGDLVEFLTTTRIHGDGQRPGWLELAQLYPAWFGMMRDYVGDGTEQGQGVLSELDIVISEALYGSFASYDGRFSARRAIQSGGQRIYLYYDYTKGTSSTLTILKTILDQLLKHSLSADNEYRTYFVLDEYSLLPPLEHLRSCLALGRDATSRGKGGCRILAALQSARLLTDRRSPEEGLTLLSLFPNVISFMVNDSLSRQVLADRYGTALYLYSQPSPGGKPQHAYRDRNVISDADFTRISKPGQAIMSLPFICDSPFLYDGYRKDGTL